MSDTQNIKAEFRTMNAIDISEKLGTRYIDITNKNFNQKLILSGPC